MVRRMRVANGLSRSQFLSYWLTCNLTRGTTPSLSFSFPSLPSLPSLSVFSFSLLISPALPLPFAFLIFFFTPCLSPSLHYVLKSHLARQETSFRAFTAQKLRQEATVLVTCLYTAVNVPPSRRRGEFRSSFQQSRRMAFPLIGNEKIIINGTINLFFLTAISILVISNHNSFRVLFDKIASAYFIRKKYIYISTLEMASPGNQHCVNCIGTLSFLI